MWYELDIAVRLVNGSSNLWARWKKTSWRIIEHNGNFSTLKRKSLLERGANSGGCLNTRNAAPPTSTRQSICTWLGTGVIMGEFGSWAGVGRRLGSLVFANAQLIQKALPGPFQGAPTATWKNKWEGKISATRFAEFYSLGKLRYSPAEGKLLAAMGDYVAWLGSGVGFGVVTRGEQPQPLFRVLTYTTPSGFQVPTAHAFAGGFMRISLKLGNGQTVNLDRVDSGNLRLPEEKSFP